MKNQLLQSIYLNRLLATVKIFENWKSCSYFLYYVSFYWILKARRQNSRREQIGPYCSDSFTTNEIEMHKLPPLESKEDNLISDSMNFHAAVPS